MSQHPDKSLIALGVRQPWAELIVRGVKTIEVRTVGTNHRGPIYVYASKKLSDHPAALVAAREHDIDLDSLPRGLIVGTVEIEESGPIAAADVPRTCLAAEHLTGRHYIGWRLRSAARLPKPLAVRFLPYGVWFYPFQRRGNA